MVTTTNVKTNTKLFTIFYHSLEHPEYQDYLNYNSTQIQINSNPTPEPKPDLLLLEIKGIRFQKESNIISVVIPSIIQLSRDFVLTTLSSVTVI
jgi:hypothetical protein